MAYCVASDSLIFWLVLDKFSADTIGTVNLTDNTRLDTENFNPLSSIHLHSPNHIYLYDHNKNSTYWKSKALENNEDFNKNRHPAWGINDSKLYYQNAAQLIALNLKKPTERVSQNIAVRDFKFYFQ